MITAALAFAAGYVASIYTWPKVKEWVNGAKTEAEALRAKAIALEAKIRAVL